jgi:hypothetical protein
MEFILLADYNLAGQSLYFLCTLVNLREATTEHWYCVYRRTHHSPGRGGEDLSHGPGILVGEEVDGGQGPVDYHSQDKDDHQADLNIIISEVRQFLSAKMKNAAL